MSVIAIILLILLGIVLLLIEFTILPGITIAGIGGALSLIASLIIAFSAYGKTGGLFTIAAIILLSPLLVYYFMKSKSSRKIILKTEIDSKVEIVDKNKIKVGSIGISLGRLAPIGKVKINGEVVEAQSSGTFIDENTNVRVLKVKFNKIIVEPINI
jgi:membrane-bound ClpP family serine protease